MAMQVMFYFGLVALLATSHYFTSPSSWQQTRLFGGLLNPPTPGRDFHLSGSITTCYGAFAIARENGWGTTGQHSDGLKNISLSLKSKSTKLIQGSNRLHTLTSFFIASLFAYWSLYLTV
eukprot:scaffold80339_cov90-Cyclotella_meneghiniana.AAC.4